MTTRLPRNAVAIAFGATLREVRTARGLSQETLADRGGFDRTYPSLLERGLRTPTLTAIFRLADALDVAAESLVSNARNRVRVLGLALPSPPTDGESVATPD